MKKYIGTKTIMADRFNEMMKVVVFTNPSYRK